MAQALRPASKPAFNLLCIFFSEVYCEALASDVRMLI